VGARPRREAHGRAAAKRRSVATADVDRYLAAIDEPKRSTLEALRTSILEVVPEAEQCISYGMPAFKVGGKTVAGFAAFTRPVVDATASTPAPEAAVAKSALVERATRTPIWS
jgi:uncharacterized protein YdhG (YjbR/CyaY superfamily)